MKWIRRTVVAVFVILLVGGVITTPATSELAFLRRYGEMIFLWVAAAAVACFPHPIHPTLLLGAALGFASEIIGVHTGIPFGRYHYTETLGWMIVDVPVVMIAAWFVLLSYAWTLAGMFIAKVSHARFLAAVFMVIVDLVIDPVAIGPMRLWEWQEHGGYYGIPFQNFIGWFIVSYLALLPVRGRNVHHAPSHLVGVAIIGFFCILALRQELWIAGTIGAILIALDVALLRSRWMQYFGAVRVWLSALRG